MEDVSHMEALLSDRRDWCQRATWDLVLLTAVNAKLDHMSDQGISIVGDGGVCDQR